MAQRLVSWSCPMCTLRNHVSSVHCGACSHKRPTGWFAQAQLGAASASSSTPCRARTPDISIGTEGKRRRCGECSFTLLDNSSDEPVANPPLFTALPLRDEQLRSLSWMLFRERSPSGVRGGVLADRMGFGKTVTTIGLISMGRPSLSYPQQLRSRAGYIECKATLVLCPAHLVSQWKGEFNKFVPSRTLQVITIPSKRAWRDLTGQAVLQADVVVAAYSVQTTDDFRKKFGISGTAAQRLGVLKSMVESWQSMDTYQKELEKVLGETGPILQLFHFHRIVMDEFHEAEGWDYRARNLYEGTSATHRWGLSGTPPIGDIRGVVDLAEILHYDEPAYQDCGKEWRTNLCRRVPLPSQAIAQRFLDTCVRQNTSDAVEAIKIVDHQVAVFHSRAERFIYQQACADHGIFDIDGDYENVSLHTREKLLKRCAHFAIGMERGSADASVEILGDAKRKRILDVQQQLTMELKRAERFGVRCRPTAQHPKTAAFLGQCHETPVECFKLELAQNTFRLVQPIPEEEYCSEGTNANRIHTLRHAVARCYNNAVGRQADAYFSELEMCGDACRPGRLQIVVRDALNKLAMMLDQAHRSLQFYQRQLASMSDSAQRTCQICLDEEVPLEQLCILPCAHIFHSSCARDALMVAGSGGRCPSCRAQVAVRDIRNFQLDFELQKESSRTEAEPTMTAAWKAHGSKLNAVAALLRKIKQEDAESKVIVFVQWRDIECRVADALSAHGIHFLWLEKHGDRTCLQDSGAILEEFQTSSHCFVMLLSLQRAASGSNLTAANHVIFVHPMNAETVAMAVDYEKQAIARIRRIGQRRSEVHVWRFVTKHTVEEHMTRIHQGHA